MVFRAFDVDLDSDVDSDSDLRSAGQQTLKPKP